MAQRLYVDFQDGTGERDYTPYLSDAGKFVDHELNKPSLFDFNLVPVGDTALWRIPTRGAYIRFYDSTFLSRTLGVSDGIVWTGYITDEPNPVMLGDSLFGYQCKATSDDYLANIKALPAKIYINKTRGFIIKDLLATMFANADALVFETSNVQDGGIERIYQVDTTKFFTDIVADFAKADGFTYYVLDKFFVYRPQAQFMPLSNDPKVRVVIDKLDPRFTPEQLHIRRQEGIVVNDVTVIGNDEATTSVREHFISDGYTGAFKLAFEPYGTTENTLLKDDFTGDDIDANTWEQSDQSQDYIQPFEGSLNVIGGAGGAGIGQGTTFLRSRKGVELSGILNFRDGELEFPPGPGGTAIIGGLYTAAEAVMAETDLLCGWKLDLNANLLYPMGPAGQETPSAYTINPNRGYVLRKQLEVDRPTRNLNTYVSSIDDYMQSFEAETGVAASCWITWYLEEINTTDPNNVTTTVVLLLRKKFVDIPDFALYAPIVSYDAHVVLNFFEVFRPQQVTVLVNGSPVGVGNALDGARCAITTDGGPKLAWYTTPLPSQAARSANLSDATTIPPQGSQVEIQYWKKDTAKARVINADSVTTERARYRDDGVRQKTLQAGDLKPIPNSSEECQALARAYLADKSNPRMEGNYTFEVGQGSPTELNYWVYPGDLMPVYIELADGTAIDQRLLVARVASEITAKDAYRFELEFGQLDRMTEALRALVFKRASSLEDNSIIENISGVDTSYLQTYTPVPDPTDWKITSITTTTAQIKMSESLPTGVVGYEVRQDDTGWGQPNYIAQFTGTVLYTFARNQRDQSFYIRPFDASGNYSRRSAFVRIVYPLQNALIITGCEGVIDPDLVSIDILLPNHPDLAGVKVTGRNPFNNGTLLYQGDGVNTIAQDATTNAVAGTSRITLKITNETHSRSYAIQVEAYDLLGTLGSPTFFTIDTPNPNVANLTPSPTDPSVFNWEGEGQYHLLVFNEDGSVRSDFVAPPDMTSVNVGDPALRRTVQVVPVDNWNKTYPIQYPPSGTSYFRDGDYDVPSKPTLSLAYANSPGSEGQVNIPIGFNFPAPAQFLSVDDLEFNWSTNSLFIGFQTAHMGNPGTPSGVKVFTQPTANLYFRLRAHNKFGWGPYSDTFSVATGSALDPISAGSGWNFLQPSLKTTLQIGAGFILSQVDDGTGRSLNGLTNIGRVAQNLPFGILQLDSGGFGRTMFRIGNHNVDDVGDGVTFARTTFNQRTGAGRGFSALDGSNLLVTGIVWPGVGVVFVDSLGNGWFRANQAIDNNGARISTDKVDNFSIRAGVIVASNIDPNFYAGEAFNTGPGDSGYDRYI